MKIESPEQIKEFMNTVSIPEISKELREFAELVAEISKKKNEGLIKGGIGFLPAIFEIERAKNNVERRHGFCKTFEYILWIILSGCIPCLFLSSLNSSSIPLFLLLSFVTSLSLISLSAFLSDKNFENCYKFKNCYQMQIDALKELEK